LLKYKIGSNLVRLVSRWPHSDIGWQLITIVRLSMYGAKLVAISVSMMRTSLAQR
jgi:hypothetical protein